MRNRLRRYLRSEWRLALFLIILGTAATALGAYGLLDGRTGFFLGASWAALLLGGVMFFFGLGNLQQHLRLSRELPLLLERTPESFLKREEERLEAGATEQKRRQLAEQLLLVAGVGLLLAGVLGGLPPFGVGVGAGLSVLAAFLLITNLLQQWSRGLYRHELEMFRRDGEL